MVQVSETSSVTRDSRSCLARLQLGPDCIVAAETPSRVVTILIHSAQIRSRKGSVQLLIPLDGSGKREVAHDA
jgi:hypothetical protein